MYCAVLAVGSGFCCSRGLEVVRSSYLGCSIAKVVMRLASQGQKICSESVEWNIKHKMLGLTEDEGNQDPIYILCPSLCHCQSESAGGESDVGWGKRAATRQQESNVLVFVRHLVMNLNELDTNCRAK